MCTALSFQAVALLFLSFVTVHVMLVRTCRLLAVIGTGNDRTRDHRLGVHTTWDPPSDISASLTLKGYGYSAVQVKVDTYECVQTPKRAHATVPAALRRKNKRVSFQLEWLLYHVSTL